MKKFSLFFGILSLLVVFVFAACSAAPIAVSSDNSPAFAAVASSDVTAEVLSSILAVVMSLVFAYVPGVREWFEAFDGVGKSRIVGLGLVLVALGVFALACANLLHLFGLVVLCTADSAVGLLRILLAALIANQAAFLLLVLPYKKE
jgi:hypothetical protein